MMASSYTEEAGMKVPRIFEHAYSNPSVFPDPDLPPPQVSSMGKGH